jgi:hypothetical protein
MKTIFTDAAAHVNPNRSFYWGFPQLLDAYGRNATFMNLCGGAYGPSLPPYGFPQLLGIPPYSYFDQPPVQWASLDQINVQRTYLNSLLGELDQSANALYYDARDAQACELLADLENSFRDPPESAESFPELADPAQLLKMSDFETPSLIAELLDVASIPIWAVLTYDRLRAEIGSFLKRLTAAAHQILNSFQISTFASTLFLLEEEWFFVHGTHPPDSTTRAIEGLLGMRGCSRPSCAQ